MVPVTQEVEVEGWLSEANLGKVIVIPSLYQKQTKVKGLW
jgi:hypothetical protein